MGTRPSHGSLRRLRVVTTNEAVSGMPNGPVGPSIDQPVKAVAGQPDS